MFLMTKAGRRGCVWGLVVCQYWGRQHSIMKRVRNASNFERLFIQCPLYRYTNYTNFRSHVKWNKIHKSLAATFTNFHSHGQEENCPKSRVVFSMMRQWTIEDYRHDLKSKRRSVIVQVMHRAPSPSLLSHSAILPCLMPKSSKTSQAVSVPVSSLHWAYLYFFDCACLPLLSKSNAPSVIHQNVLTGLYALIYIYKYRWSFLYFYYFYSEHKTNNNVQLTIWHWLAAVQQE